MLAAPTPAGPVTGDAAQQAARDELRRLMYHRNDPSLIDRFFNWLGDRSSHLVDGSISGSSLLIVVILIGAVLIFAVVRAGRPRRRTGGPAAPDPLAPRGDVDHRQLAERFSAEARYGEALREWLRAAVQNIEGRGLLEPRPGRTGSEIAREAGLVLPDAAPPLQVATTAFDEIWFGERPARAEDAAAGRVAADTVAAARPRRSQPAAAGYARPS